MKANLYLILASITVLPLIYIGNHQKHHWIELIPLGYLVYTFVVGTISAIKNR